MKQSGGFVWVKSAPGHGTVFEVDLPAIVRPATPHADAPDESTASLPGTEPILLVEEEAPVRSLELLLLVRQGYPYLETATVTDSLSASASHPGRLDLLLADIVMPEASGRAASETLVARHPGLRVLFMSGYTDDEILRRGLHAPGMSLLVKPFTAERLLATVRGVLDGE